MGTDKSLNQHFSLQVQVMGAYFGWVPIILYGTHTTSITVLLSCSRQTISLAQFASRAQNDGLDIVNKPPTFLQDDAFTLGL